ncbi:MAG: M24 family metallopeptidase, partial [Nitriliruptoraceae bacterium]
MIVRKNAAEIEAMRAAGRVVARAHDAIQQAAVAGVSLQELDAIAEDVLRAEGASSPFKGYQPHFAPTPFP